MRDAFSSNHQERVLNCAKLDVVSHQTLSIVHKKEQGQCHDSEATLPSALVEMCF